MDFVVKINDFIGYPLVIMVPIHLRDWRTKCIEVPAELLAVMCAHKQQALPCIAIKKEQL